MVGMVQKMKGWHVLRNESMPQEIGMITGKRQSRFRAKSQNHLRLEEKQKFCFHCDLYDIVYATKTPSKILQQVQQT